MARTGQYYNNGGSGSGYDPYSNMTVGDYANGIPSIRVSEFIRSFFKQFRWLIPLFLLGAIPAYIVTKDIKRKYKGEGRVLVQLGSEYVYNDVATNTPSQTMTITPDVIALNETAIMKNSEIIEQVIGQMVMDVGEERFAKHAFEKIRRAEASGNSEALANAKVDLHKFVDKNYVVTPQAKSSVIDIEFKHDDGEVAVKTTNAFIEAYLAYRRTIFIEGSSEAIAEQRKMTEEELRKTEMALKKYLQKNGISDFDSERTGATGRTENLRAELATLQSSITETEAALASVEQQLREQPGQIDLYIDDRAGQRVAQAELELKQLLAKYLPTSDPVRAKRAEIQELKSLQSANNGNAIGGRRVGPNPVYQSLMTRRNQLASVADSLREKEFTVQSLLNSTDAKVRKFQNLTPEYNNLVRQQNTLQQRLRGYSNKEQEALVNQKQAESNSENVHVISYATLPRKGRNMRKIMFGILMLGWGFTLFMAALLRVFMNPSLYASPPDHNQRAPIPEPVNYNPGRYNAPPHHSVPEPVPVAPAAASAYAQPYTPASAAATPYDASAAMADFGGIPASESG